MTIKEVLQETAMIEMSLDNLGICYNEGIAGTVISAISRTIQRFISWIVNTVIPFIQRILKFIGQLLRKTKLGRKIFAKKDAKKAAELEAKEKAEQEEIDEEDEKLRKIKRNVLAHPNWINPIVHGILNVNHIMKFANSTEDRSTDIAEAGKNVDKYISDGKQLKETNFVDGVGIAREQLKILESSMKAFEKTSKSIVDKCNELKRSIEGKTDIGSAGRGKNINSVLQLIMKKDAEIMKQAVEQVTMLEKVVDPTKMYPANKKKIKKRR